MLAIMVSLVNRQHPDPITQERIAFKKGDIMSYRFIDSPLNIKGIKSRKANWLAAGNSEETWHNLTGWIFITGNFSSTLVEDLMDSHFDFSIPDDPIILLRRKWSTLIDNVPIALKQELIQNGEVTVSKAQVKSYLQNKITLLGHGAFD